MCKLCLFNRTRQINTIFSQQEKILMLLFWLSRPAGIWNIFDQCQKIPTNKPSGLSAWYAPLTIENPVTRRTDKLSIFYKLGSVKVGYL